MPASRVPSVVDAMFLAPKPQKNYSVGIRNTYLRHIVIFFQDNRIEHIPNIGPAMKATDLRQMVYKATRDHFPELENTTAGFSDLLEQDPDFDVLLYFETPWRWFFRKLEDVESDAELWEEMMNFEFPHRHYVLPQWDGAREEKRRFAELEGMTEEVGGMELMELMDRRQRWPL